MMTLYHTADISLRVEELGMEISKHYAQSDKPLCIIAILKGSFMFLADLVRCLSDKKEYEIEFISASSYGNEEKSSGNVNILYLDPQVSVKDKDVLLVDDILDSGRTLLTIKNHLLTCEPASIQTVVFLDKPKRREVDFQADFVGFKIPDYFVFGYGMDKEGKERNLPIIKVKVREQCVKNRT